MIRKLDLPSPSQEADGRLVAPSALRNADAITALLADVAADLRGDALEIASGTGQHMAHLARALPALTWQPSDPDGPRRASIDGYCASLDNVRPAIDLDATNAGWGAQNSGHALIFLSNLLHLISDTDAKTLLQEAARATDPGGRLVIYGPFMRDEELTSAGDAAFHAELVRQDPEIGYKDDFDVIDWAQEAGFDLREVVEMPANNLSFVFAR